MNPLIPICFIIFKGVVSGPETIDAAIPLIEKAGVSVEVVSIETEVEDLYASTDNVFRYTRKVFGNFGDSECFVLVLSGKPSGTLRGRASTNCSSHKRGVGVVFNHGNTAIDSMVVAHETGHLIGMTHHNYYNKTIDNSSAGPWTEWSRPAVREMHRCLKRKK